VRCRHRAAAGTAEAAALADAAAVVAEDGLATGQLPKAPRQLESATVRPSRELWCAKATGSALGPSIFDRLDPACDSVSLGAAALGLPRWIPFVILLVAGTVTVRPAVKQPERTARSDGIISV